LGDADPAGAVLVGLAVTVPVKLHLDAPVLVGPDFLAGRTDDERRLRALHDGLRRRAGGPERGAAVDRLEAASEREALAPPGLVLAEHDVLAAGDDQVLPVLIP